MMMNCRKCSAELPDGAVFCHLCGARQVAAPRRHKRSNGEGSVRKRGATYTARARKVINGEEIEVTKGGFRTKADAYNALPALRNTIGKPAPKEVTVVTLQMLYDEWHDTACKELSESKQCSYRTAAKRIKALLPMPVVDITISHLQNCIIGLTHYPARDVKSLFSHLYKRARAQQLVTANLSEFMILPAVKESEPIPFNKDEVQTMWLTWNSGDIFSGYALLMVYTGMMPGELQVCRKSNIDIMNQRIVGSGLKTKERKIRSLLLPDEIIPVIKKLMEVNDSEMLLPITKDKFYDEYHAYTARVGIRDLVPYSCRHTTGTIMGLSNEVAPTLITKALRQKRPITTERYKHAEEMDVISAMNKAFVGYKSGTEHKEDR